MNEQIGVTYFPLFGGLGYHMALFYTNSAGVTRVIEVGPADQSLGPTDLARAFMQEQFFSNHNTDSPWGRIVGGEREWGAADAALPAEVLREGDDLSVQWRSIQDTLSNTMTDGFEYQGPFRQNSNTFVRQALENAELPRPTGNVTDEFGNTKHYWAPGTDHLTDPINQNQSSNGPDVQYSTNTDGDGNVIITANFDDNFPGGITQSTGLLTAGGLFLPFWAAIEAGGQVIRNLFPNLPDYLHFIARDPIVLDLNGNGIELTSLSGSAVHFDYAGDGFAERTGWASPTDGILAIDANNNGLIDNGLELFGSPTQDGFAVLEKLDTNFDGKISAEDVDFSKLKVWRDLNQNGVTDADELQSLSAAGIASIDLAAERVGGTNAGHGVGYQATFVRTDGTAGSAQTIYFQTDPRNSIDNTPNFTPSGAALLIPQLAGSGEIRSIAYKATNDGVFLADWTALADSAAEISPADLEERFEQLLLRWAGVDTVEPTSRGPYVNARHLAFLEKFFGDTYRYVNGSGEVATYPTEARFGAIVEGGFAGIVSRYKTAFLSQLAHSAELRGVFDADTALSNPYLFYGLLDFSSHAQGDPSAPTTPGNVGIVVDLIIEHLPVLKGEQTAYVVRALTGLTGVIDAVFAGNGAAYAALVEPRLAGLTDPTLHAIATHIVDGTARFGTTSAEGLNGSAGADVFIGGGGGDVAIGGAGGDIYVYEKRDGDLWIKDDGPTADADRLVLTDLNASDVGFVRIGDSLLIEVTATGKTVTVEQFFAGQGIDILRFADGTEWSRAQLEDASVFQGDGHANLINDSSADDVIRGGQGDDFIRIGAGKDTILYGKGDGYDIVEESGTPTLGDRFVLTDLNSNDVELSRVGGRLILTVKATGEYVDFRNFFPVSTGDWATAPRNIDEIAFADGVSWGRAEIQQQAWYRGTDRADTIGAAELDDTLVGGKGDDILEGGRGSDTFVWRKGDGNDQIADSSSKVGDPGNTDVDTLWLQDVEAGDVSYSYQGKTLLLTINSTGEILTVANFLSGVTDLTTGAGANEYGIDVIKFADGSTIGRQQITYNAGAGYLGWNPAVFTWVVQGLVVWQYFVDEFGHAGNIVGHQVAGPNDIWNASIYGGLGGRLGTPLDLQPDPFHSDGKNVLNGNNGNDILYAGAAQDVLKGGGGNDILYGEDGNDIIDGEGGNDALYGDAGMDLMSGGSGGGADYLSGGAGKDYMSASDGNDTFIGGAGDDVIISNDAGQGGSDTFIYSRGDGNDLIFESGNSNAASETDVLVLTDIAAGDVVLTRTGDDLLFTVKTTQETVTVASHFQNRGDDNNIAGNGLEAIRFADTAWDRAQIQKAAWIRGTDGRDVLDNTTTNAQLDDTFVGGKGNDVIFAGRGGDTFVYASGDGSDVINDATNRNFAPNAVDKLKFTDLNSSDVELSRSGNDLLIKVPSTGAVITVMSQFAESANAPGSGLEQIQFADGQTFGRPQIQENAWFRGTDGRDFIDPQSNLNDTFRGDKGDDVIYSGYQSASGSDTFLYARGDGNDIIREQTWNSFSSTEIDTLKLTDIDSADIRLSRSGNDLLVKILSTNETVTILGQFGDAADAPGMGLEYIQFANGDRWGRDTIMSVAASSSPFIAGTNGSDMLVGSAVTQNMYGEAGNDTLDGQGGSDLLYGGLGDDRLIVSVSNAGDLVTADGGVGTDTLDLSGLGVAAWVDLVTNGAEARTRDQADLASGTWRDVADVARVENVTGTAFSDQISGDAGNNVLAGGDGNDVLDSRSGDDVILAGAGNDALTGGMGADLLDGGDGADIVNGGLGTDTLIGGAGNDTLTGGTEGDVFAIGTGAGSDTIADFAAGSAAGHDRIRFDRAVFSDFASVLAAATQSGTDVAIALGGGDSLTLQNVDLSALMADNFEFRRLENQAPSAISVAGGAVSENSIGGTVVANLTAVDAGDTGVHSFNIVGGHPLFEIVGNEIRVKDGAIVDFEAGSRYQLNVQASDDDGLSVTSAIVIDIVDQTETLTGTAGNDALTAGSGADILIGGAGNDVMTGGAGSDEYRYNPGDGRDRIVDGGGASDTDRLVLGSGIDPASIVVARSSLANSDVVLRLATGETIALQDQLSSAPGAGIEEIRFADNTVWSRSDILGRLDSHLIVGSTGTETLTGSGTADVFEAGIGNETLSGYGGGDTYRIGAGAGNDVIVEGNEAGTDRIELVGLNRADVRFIRTDTDLIIRIVSTGHTITVPGQFGLTTSGVEQVAFADGTVWDRTQIAENSATQGTAGGDTVNGTPGDDVFQPGTGNDVIQGGAGSDTVIYALGDGSDTINDGVNSPTQTDVLRFIDLNANDVQFSRNGSNLLIRVLSSGDVITVQQQFTSPADFWGIERVQFADGTVWDKAAILAAAWIRGTAAAETLYGTSDADTIDGQAGNDILRGVNGGDTYVYGAGSGNDTVDEVSSDSGTDVIRLVGLTSSGLQFSRSGNDLLIRINASGETLRVVNQFNGTNGVEQVTFADGSTWDRTQIFNASPILGSSGNDTFYGSADAEVFDGKGGNDTLNGAGGGDTYIYAVGSGNDTIGESSSDSGTDVIRLVGLNAADVLFSRSGNDLLIQINSSGETLKVTNQFNGTNGIEQVAFADGSTWDRTQIFNSAWVRGTSGNDTFYGSADAEVFDGKGGNDTLNGAGGGDTYIYGVGSGNDTIGESSSDSGTDAIRLVGLNAADVLFSRSGNDLFVRINSSGETLKVVNQFNGANGIEQIVFADGTVWDRSQISDAAWVRGTAGADTLGGNGNAETFDGGGGNDTLRGYGAGDTYIYGVGSGNDTVDENSGDSGTDVIKLVGLNSPDTLFSRSGNDLFVRINSSGETLKVVNQFNGTNGIEQVAFADGTVWDRSQISNAAWVRGTAGADALNGNSNAETFDGGGGSDTLRGYGAGDTYIYGIGSGNDTVDENSGDSGTDVIKLVGLNSSDVLFSRSGNDLFVQINSSGETLKVVNQFNGTNGIEQVVFADGTTWDRPAIASAAWYRGTSGNDTISGSTSNDTIAGGAGNDTMSGGAGSDTFVFRTNPGQDVITDFAPGQDVLQFMDGIFADAAAALAAATASGSHTIITIDASNSILLQNVALANLNTTDFHIV